MRLLFALLMGCGLAFACGNSPGLAMDAGAPTDAAGQEDAAARSLQVLFTNPPAGAQGIARDTAISVLFSERIDPGTLDTESFALADEGGEAVIGAVAADGYSVTFEPDEPLADGTGYTARVTEAVRSLVGSRLEGDHTWSFWTTDNPDRDPPKVLWTVPAAAALDAASSASLTVVFDEPIDPTTVNPTTLALVDENGATIAGSFLVDEVSVTFLPLVEIAWETAFTATLMPGVADLSGNPRVQAFTWSFRTGEIPDTSPPQVLLTTPLDGAVDVPTNAALQVFFDEPIDPTSVTSTSFELADEFGNLIDATIQVGTTSFVVTPTVRLAYQRTYTATVTTGVTDLAGNPIAEPFVWSFASRVPSWGAPVAIEFENAGQSDDPRVAMDVDGNAVVVWTHGSTTGSRVWANEYKACDGWQAPHIINLDTERQAVGPELSVNAAGDAAAIWEQRDIASGGSMYVNICATRYESGDGWETPECLMTGATWSVGAARVALDDAGIALAVWKHTGYPYGFWSSRHWGIAGWTEPEVIQISAEGSSYDPQVATDAAGRALVVWAQAKQLLPHPSLWAIWWVPGLGWGTPLVIAPGDQNDASAPQAGVDAVGNAIATWRQSDGVRERIWARRYVVGDGWGEAEPIDSTGHEGSHANRLAVSRNGTAIAVWEHYEALERELWASRYQPGSGWSSAELVASCVDTHPSSLRIAIDGFGNGVVVWQRYDGTRNNVWVNRYQVGYGWGVAGPLETEDGWADAPDVTMSPAGEAIAVWTQYNGLAHNIVARHLK